MYTSFSWTLGKLFVYYANFDVTTLFLVFSYTCDEMFIQCTFGGLPMTCCEFAKPVLTDMGKCYQFENYSQTKWLNKQYISGPYHGFQAFINASINEYPSNYIL